MTSIPANDVRIPPGARAALARHERVVVLSHGRPAFVIINPSDLDDETASTASRRGRPLREALAILATAPVPDRRFGDDLEAIHLASGMAPADPWERS
ncbi:MAG: hypothetical protein ACR2MY_04830 [Candidatus Dormibacteria bacterium]